MNRYFNLVILLLFIAACQNRTLEKWKEDKEACNGFRSVGITEELLKKIPIQNKTYLFIIDKFGIPDKEHHTSKFNKFLKYTIENNCHIKEKDICILTINIERNKVINFSISCT
ncbi:hypothetical protein V3Q90_02390 [Flavobacterium oreochromis]|uniref:Lipoprotein n=1 Tax=Flavobacterium oreochromis TaxID=2906078 RepID=A0ABW8P443_9FLAO|nr:hypothetical protein [Flavobacterium oreochromis]